MNIFQYIPAHSSHPPGLIKSIFHSLLNKYWCQNTERKDFIKITRLLFNRLIAKGFKANLLIETFSKAATKIENTFYLSNNTSLTEDTPFNKRLFFHLPYHPRNISRLTIRNEYENICESLDKLGHSFKSFPTPSRTPLKIEKLTIY